MIPDTAAAIAELNRRHSTDIALFGTSLGVRRSMLYHTAAHEPAIKAYGLIAAIMSPYEEAQYRMSAIDRQCLDVFLADCTHENRRTHWVDGTTHYLQPGWIAERYAEAVSTWVANTLPVMACHVVRPKPRLAGAVLAGTFSVLPGAVSIAYIFKRAVEPQADRLHHRGPAPAARPDTPPPAD